MNHEKNLIIFSVFQNSLSLNENLKNHERVRSILLEAGIEHEVWLGCFEGNLEKSFVVKREERSEDSLISGLMRKFKQDSVLIVRDDGEAELWEVPFHSGNKFNLGRWKRTLNQPPVENWSLNPKTLEYWITDEGD